MRRQFTAQENKLHSVSLFFIMVNNCVFNQCKIAPTSHVQQICYYCFLKAQQHNTPQLSWKQTSDSRCFSRPQHSNITLWALNRLPETVCNAQRQWDVRGSWQEDVGWASGISSYNPCTVINDHSPVEGRGTGERARECQWACQIKALKEKNRGTKMGDMLNLVGCEYNREWWGCVKEHKLCERCRD